MRVVLMTCPPSEAESIVQQLLEERLIGCGNIVPGVRSLYWWEGKICRDDEALVVMESPEHRIQALTRRIGELHPYSVPKIVSLHPDACNAAYVDWLKVSTTVA